MQKKNSEKYLYTAFSVIFILFAFLFSVHFWCFNEDFYRREHSKITLYGQHIAEYIGISEEELDELTHFTLIYLNDPDASLDKVMNIKGEDREVFTDDEKLHMVDVRRLNLIADYLLIATGIISFILIFRLIIKKEYSPAFYYYRRVLRGAGVIVLFLGAWILIDFDSFWTSFHHLFFAGNDLWLLDLRKDILIMIVPPEFFNHLVLMITFTFVFLLIIFYFVLRKAARKVEG